MLRGDCTENVLEQNCQQRQQPDIGVEKQIISGHWRGRHGRNGCLSLLLAAIVVDTAQIDHEDRIVIYWTFHQERLAPVSWLRRHQRHKDLVWQPTVGGRHRRRNRLTLITAQRHI